MELKSLLICVTLGILIGTYLTFAYTFLLAYKTKEKEATIYIDKYNEAEIELIVLIISLPAIIYTVIHILKWLKNEEKKEKIKSYNRKT